MEYYKNHPANGVTETKYFESEGKIDDNIFSQDIRGSHYEIAQLVLWREDAGSPNENSHYWASVVGGSGPATLALSTLFINMNDGNSEDQELLKNLKKTGNLLCKLQFEVREKFMTRFQEKLIDKMQEIVKKCGEQKNEEQIRAYFKLVKYAVSFYLQTVLYRYFFPFLSPSDMERIRNGMYTMLNSMKTAKVSPFVLEYNETRGAASQPTISKEIVEEIIKQIPEILYSSLQSFKGLEAFYLVTVKHHLKNDGKDIRENETIEILTPDNNSGTSQIINLYYKYE